MRSATKQVLLLVLVLALSLLFAASGCGPATAPPRPTPPPAPDAGPPAPRGGLIFFECTPADAQITVDGTARGSAEEISRAGGLRLPIGLHRFEITRDGYRAYRIELNVADKPERLRVQLQPVSPLAEAAGPYFVRTQRKPISALRPVSVQADR